VTLKLTSFSLGTVLEVTPSFAPTSKYSSVLNELLFHPQLWLTENSSGALVKRVSEDPVALAQEIVKYAFTALRGSR
jgi:hypothetical protein